MVNSVEQKIQAFLKENPKYKMYNKEALLSILVENAVISKTELEQVKKGSVWGNKIINPSSDLIEGLEIEKTNSKQPVEQKPMTVTEFYNLRHQEVNTGIAEAEEQNGPIGSAWSGFKNMTGWGDDSDKIRD